MMKAMLIAKCDSETHSRRDQTAWTSPHDIARAKLVRNWLKEAETCAADVFDRETTWRGLMTSWGGKKLEDSHDSVLATIRQLHQKNMQASVDACAKENVLH